MKAKGFLNRKVPEFLTNARATSNNLIKTIDTGRRFATHINEGVQKSDLPHQYKEKVENATRKTNRALDTAEVVNRNVGQFAHHLQQFD